ncbi:MAG: RecX family transcriptional regulator [Chloroflexi bacterium]|nr:MAG: RecX family transcriptional regulator [Chloroflexota bacterium]
MRVTAIERPPRKRRYNVRIDGARVIPLSREVLAAANLRVGQEVDDSRVAELEAAEARHTAMASALRLLSYRQRSEREMRDALRSKGIPEAIAGETLDRLRELRLLDDQAFAEAWTESRQRHRPRGRRMLLAELAQKGVERELAQASVAEIDEEADALRAGRKRSQTLRGREFREFRRRLGDFLARRGFGYDVCEATIKQLWAEVATPTANSGTL